MATVEEKKTLVSSRRRSDLGNKEQLFRADYGEGLKRFPGVFGGIVDDFQRRYADYWTDVEQGWTQKTLSAALQMYLATFCSTIALASSIQRRTNSQIGFSEYLLMNGIAGMVHAAFGCQPLLILRPTGPITLMLVQIYALAATAGVEFLPLVAWTGIGISFWMTVIAATEFSRHIAMLTTFAHDAFACFVSSIYVVDGITGVINRLADEEVPDSLFALLISFYLILCALVLTNLRSQSDASWLSFIPKRTRHLLADYALGLATITATAISFSSAGRLEVDRLDIPGNHGDFSANPTSPGRRWPIPLSPGQDNTALIAFIGIAVSIPITIFFYFDQNFSSLLCQQPSMQLDRGSYYHSSFLFMAGFNVIGPLIGLPFVTGSLPHSPQMVRALTNQEPKLGTPKVSENRIAPFIMYTMILLSYLVLAQVIEAIPVAAADAVLIFVGLEGIMDTRIWPRLRVFFIWQENCPAEYGEPGAARLFTLLQLSVIIAGWILNETPAALAFPLVIACLVPIRTYLLPALFTKKQLRVLDSEDVAGNHKKNDALCLEEDDEGDNDNALDVEADSKGHDEDEEEEI